MRRIEVHPLLLLVLVLVPFELPGKVGVPRSFFVSTLDLEYRRHLPVLVPHFELALDLVAIVYYLEIELDFVHDL